MLHIIQAKVWKCPLFPNISRNDPVEMSGVNHLNKWGLRFVVIFTITSKRDSHNLLNWECRGLVSSSCELIWGESTAFKVNAMLSGHRVCTLRKGLLPEETLTHTDRASLYGRLWTGSQWAKGTEQAVYYMEECTALAKTPTHRRLHYGH